MIDSHCHLDFEIFDKDLDKIINQNKVSKFIIPAISINNFTKIKKITKTYPQCYGAYGLHPWMIEQHHEEDIIILDNFLNKNTSVAVGEIGIDLFNQFKGSKEKQQWFFIKQLELAQKYKLPIIIHSRKSVDLIYEILKDFKDITGVFHGYSGSLQQAENLITRGFYLGVGSILTYPNTKIRQVIQQIPLEKIILETDAPSHSPNGIKTNHNEPKYLKNIIEAIAEIKQTSIDKIEKITDKNTKELFKI
ncbi:Putative deoxyribonuclease YcfH [hydrothermal vent metagenome]|uniref:Putative deoxyribonuclease YcfH n=1 Tax=hydrothermal vent metagenome TaxID=652676 RepID=A0A1W1CMU6_9ZZZZ